MTQPEMFDDDTDAVMAQATPIERGEPELPPPDLSEPDVVDPKPKPKELAKPPVAWPVQMMDDKAGVIADACSGVDANALRSTMGMAILANPDILKCSKSSVLQAVLAAAKLGVDPTGKRNGAYYTTRFNKKAGCMECSLQLGYGAIVTLMKRHGDVSHVDVACVFPEDSFSVVQGTFPAINHTPDFEADRKQECVAVYAVAHLVGGGFKFEVMNKGEIDHIRKEYTRGQGFSPWKSEPNEMAKKTVLHRLAKTMDLSPHAADAVRHIETTDYDVGQPDPAAQEHTRPSIVELEGEL